MYNFNRLILSKFHLHIKIDVVVVVVFDDYYYYYCADLLNEFCVCLCEVIDKFDWLEDILVFDIISIIYVLFCTIFCSFFLEFLVVFSRLLRFHKGFVLIGEN